MKTNRKILFCFAALSVLIPALIGMVWGQTMAPSTQPAPRRWVWLSPSGFDAGGNAIDDSPQIRAAWMSGANVICRAGVWHILSPCYRPFHASLKGESELATIITCGAGVGSVGAWAFTGAGDGENTEGPETSADGGGIFDLTLDSSDQPGYAIYANGQDEPGLTFQNLRIVHGCGPRCISTGMVCNGIEFDYSSLTNNSNHVTYEHLQWNGAPDSGGNEWLFGGANNLVEHCLWSHTQRGIVVRYPATQDEFTDLFFDGVRALPGNANEVFLQEGGSFTNSVIDTVVMHDCVGSLFQFGNGGVSEITISHVNSDSRGGLSVGTNYAAGATMGLNGTSVTAIHITQCEFAGCTGFFFDGSTGNAVDNTTVIAPRPGEGGQLNPLAYANYNAANTPNPCVFNQVAGNAIDPQTVKVIDLPAGWGSGIAGQ